MNLKEALEIIVVPEERYAQLRINRGDAQELWELLERLHAAELEGEGNKDRIDGKMYAWDVKAEKRPGTVHIRELEETPQITALDRDGVYTIPQPIASPMDLEHFGRTDGPPLPKSGWYAIPNLDYYKITWYEAGTKSKNILYGPLPDITVLSLSQQATEAQGQETQEATF